MRRITREEYPIDTLHRIVNGVTFFKDLIQTDPTQFELLMSVTQFVTADENEIVLHRGEDANVLYFLLKGQLAVMSDDNDQDIINTVNPGEMFGVMAMVMKSKRSASIKVGGRSALLAGIDYQHFNDLHDFTLFSLSTKISFFRMLSNHIRWTLEQNKMQVPDHPLVARLRKLPLYSGEKNTPQELEFLFEQAHIQADLLCEWNESLNRGGSWQQF
ncbi:MAG: cyclic nucleotide-binding protein [Oceanospirillaceae bacterium]|uniref:cyclic nucleotide-binding domain-containing protein n=1 Tax=unclassified Thalassolituus TaxID=2624967 RepID=UPI000C65FF2E|nr:MULTISPECIES: cyclic nucleotide-binding domain-containing protein [unclassified Thalassolituus]MAS26451.1 cyclic nucleotide-binding protein [Oceanospirillaceae bacterium]MAX98270.1 cyclic nucleotide-binding protein [Oceanospirillaceae bacterium]MBL34514.1 cyclic nucleotide-binding protein [Oceanospirillaceae bacterium]MBS54185.1 cyclic nucleotide-binding protein [Oceanospirillaceae bacterium]|tara:strand:- start:44 stop:691 length:648 start_codon:yes stop_codon:yes gene_type:complete